MSRFQVLGYKQHASSLRSLLVVYHFSLSGRNLVFDPYAAYVLKRWQEDVYEAKHLYEEIPAQGFPGTVRIVQRFVRVLVDEPKAITFPPASAAERFSANNATWLFIHHPKQLTTEELVELELICQRSQTARKTYELTQQFMTMLRLRRGQEFEAWLSAVEASHIPELRRFVYSLLRDKDAVVAGLTLPYSNGPVEAQVHKRETWSSVRCLVGRSCLCYGNACFMRSHTEWKP